jgi:Transposase/DDE superfamily endonuclease
MTGLGKSTIHRMKMEMEMDKENLKGGRPCKVSASDQRRIVDRITSGRFETAVQATKWLNTASVNPVQSQTVRNILKQHDLNAGAKSKKPMLKAAHRKRRLEFAQYHREWTIDDWRRVLWTDETKINRYGSDGRQWVWKKRGEPLSDRTTTTTVKFGGGSIMVWGCMGWNGVGKLIEVQGKMDAEQYCAILDDAVVESMEKLDIPLEDAIFQQDNDPKHTSRRASKWFEDNQVNVMTWPAQSPDLNPIEHLWEHVKRKLKGYEHPPKGVHEIWDRLVVEWNNIGPEVCQNLVESMPRRIAAVIRAEGGHTKY